MCGLVRAVDVCYWRASWRAVRGRAAVKSVVHVSCVLCVPEGFE